MCALLAQGMLSRHQMETNKPWREGQTAVINWQGHKYSRTLTSRDGAPYQTRPDSPSV